MSDQLRQAAQAMVDVHDKTGVITTDRLEALRAALAEQEVCEWTQDSDGFWDASCGEAFVYDSEHPREAAKFCPNCGKPIKFKESDDE